MSIRPDICTILMLIITAGPSLLHAQVLYSADAKITVSRNTTLTVLGEVENEGNIVNNGHIKVAGPWVNSGLYQPGEGQVTFNGTSPTIPQIIHHNGQSFNTINISGGTKKVLLSDIVVNKEIRLDHGIVESAGDARLIFSPNAVISGASDISHVHGVVFHEGSGHKLFPIGDGVAYRPVELPDVNDASAMIGIRELDFGNVELSVSPSLGEISRERYWHIDIESGSLPRSPIVLPVQDLLWTNDPAKVVVVQSESMTEDFQSIGRSRDVDVRDGKIRSEFDVSMPFVALATTGEELTVYNAVSDNGDGFNSYVRIENIENYPDNKFTLYNRWGDVVFQMAGYDNDQRIFRGRANVNSDSKLVSGTYFYVLEFSTREPLRGFIAVKN